MTNSPTSLSAFDYLKLDDLEQIVLTEAQHRRDTNRIADIYPDEGPLRRELYPKHIAFFKQALLTWNAQPLRLIASARPGVLAGLRPHYISPEITPSGGRDAGSIIRSR